MLDGRTSLGAGLGYRWMERDDLSFTTEAGVGFRNEQYSDEEDTSTDDVTARGAYYLMKELDGHIAFLHDLTHQPAFSELADYNLTTSAQLRVKITESIFSNVKFALDYDATPAEDEEKTDTRFVVGLGVTF